MVLIICLGAILY
jgi:hypothetical protein